MSVLNYILSLFGISYEPACYHLVESAVFKDGDRWSWKSMYVGKELRSMTSFYHYPTREDALASAAETYHDYTLDKRPMNKWKYKTPLPPTK